MVRAYNGVLVSSFGEDDGVFCSHCSNFILTSQRHSSQIINEK